MAINFMNPIQKRKLNKECECNHINDADYNTVEKGIKKQNKLLITIGAIIGIIAMVWLIVGIVISNGLMNF